MKSTGYQPSTTSAHKDFSLLSCQHKSLVAVAVATCFSLSNVAFAADSSAEVENHGSLNAAEIFQDNNYKLNVLTHEDGNIHNYDSVSITHVVPTVKDQYTVSIENGSVLNVEGKFSIDLTAPKNNGGNDPANYALYVHGKSATNPAEDTTAHLKGDVSIILKQYDENGTIGANGVYVDDGATAILGSSGTTTQIWAIGDKPDTLSAKGKGTIRLESTNNQIVGNMDFLDDNPGGTGSSITGTFSGPDAYWFGDEQGWANALIHCNENKKLSGEYHQLIQSVEGFPTLSISDTLTLTFRNGAQWTYFGIADPIAFSTNKLGSTLTGTIQGIQKRISSIRLEDGGIINLYDENIQKTWKDLGLLDAFKELAEVNHDYVRIGDLQGSGGIFRLDLNANKSADGTLETDVVFIEGSSLAGQHLIEPYKPHLLTSLGGENTLIFAVTKKNKLADDEVTFADKINLEGESLYDYELQIASDKFTTDDVNRAELEGKLPNYTEYVDGTKWFIERVSISHSAAARGFTGAGYASYDAAVEMDRHDRRLAETVRNVTDPENGLWVRIYHGRSGAENQYRWDRTGATIGFDRDLSPTNRLGAWFSYTEGDTEFLDVRGDGDMKRYEAALFDTITLDNHYIDLVARFGRVSSDFSVGNRKFSTSGDYDQDYAAVSAEYGYTLRDTNGVFIEPQVQVQAAYLKSFDYTSNRDMKVEADSATSVIGRAGFRAGRALETSNSAGELYFRADVLHQFTDGQDAEFSGPDGQLDETWGDTGTWANFGVGAVWQWKDTLGFQFDLERIAGGKTDDTWLVSGRFNYFF